MKLSVAMGKRIKELMFKKNITQYKLAKITCLSQNCLSNFLNGKTNDVKLTTIYLIALTLEIPLSEIFTSPLFDIDNIEI